MIDNKIHLVLQGNNQLETLSYSFPGSFARQLEWDVTSGLGYRPIRGTERGERPQEETSTDLTRHLGNMELRLMDNYQEIRKSEAYYLFSALSEMNKLAERLQGTSISLGEILLYEVKKGRIWPHKEIKELKTQLETQKNLKWRLISKPLPLTSSA